MTLGPEDLSESDEDENADREDDACPDDRGRDAEGEFEDVEPEPRDMAGIWFSRLNQASVGLSLKELESVYGPLSQDAGEYVGGAENGDDPSEPLKTAKQDKQAPLSPVQNMEDLERLHRQGRIESDKQDTGLRKILAVWSLAAASTMLVLGSGIFVTYMISEWGHVPVEAMLGWLSSSVVEVLGIVYLVANYLFPKPKGNE